MAALSSITSDAALAGAEWPTTVFSISIMKSGVASPSTLMTNEAAASFRMTGRTRIQSGAYQRAPAALGSFSRITRARVPSAITSSSLRCQTCPSTTSSTIHWPARPATTT